MWVEVHTDPPTCNNADCQLFMSTQEGPKGKVSLLGVCRYVGPLSGHRFSHMWEGKTSHAVIYRMGLGMCKKLV
jgi:hypothetical protein